MRGVRVLVTGGCGFIGANLVPMLLERGLDVRVYDNLSNGGPDRVPGAEVLEGDVRDADTLAAAAAGVDAVIHLAAAGNVPDSVKDPVTNFEINGRGTLLALQAAARADAGRFVFASTGGALIGNAPPPVDETSVPRPISPYGASKLCGEGYCHAFAGSQGLRTVSLRFAIVYGPRSERKKGAITAFIQRALRGEPLVVYGDGRATRDFIYVDDLCQGIVLGLEHPDARGVFHLASERETAIAELAGLVVEATGADVPVDHLPPRPGEVERNFASCELARRTLGFAPGVDLEDGLARTVAWFRDAG